MNVFTPDRLAIETLGAALEFITQNKCFTSKHIATDLRRKFPTTNIGQLLVGRQVRALFSAKVLPPYVKGTTVSPVIREERVLPGLRQQTVFLYGPSKEELSKFQWCIPEQ